ncbi:MAG: tetratricopeptide repeat protein [Bacteroidales bacterium]
MKRDRHIIQKYLDHDLTDKDMRRFEADLESSPELQADLGLYQEIDEALADTEVLSFRDQLSDLRRETQRSGGTRKAPIRFTKPWHYAATAAIALILAIGLASVLDRPLTNKDLLKKYYKPYEVALINRSNNSTLDLMLKNAEILYQRGDFEEAVVYFEKVLEEQPELAGTNLYTGISYYELERYSEAQTSLNKVIAHNDNLYIEQAEWYLGLCFLAIDENDRARRQFARIASGNSDKAGDAKKLLKKIRR